MSSNNDGGPAFPCGYVAQTGMTLRDWFAGQAVAGMAAGELWGENAQFKSGGGTQYLDDLAKNAYGLADAMLKARNAGKEQQ